MTPRRRRCARRFDLFRRTNRCSRNTQGKKLNPEIIKNGIVRASNLTDECALICAKVFIESLRFAGELDADFTLLPPPRAQRSEPAKESDQSASSILVSASVVSGDLESYSLTLDASKRRRVIVQAPPHVTRAELKRIQDWLSFQLLVEDTFLPGQSGPEQ